METAVRENAVREAIRTNPELLKMLRQGYGQFQELTDHLFSLLKKEYPGIRRKDILILLCKIDNFGGL